MAEHLSKASFVASLGSRYRLPAAGNLSPELELVELREGRSGPRNEQFALLFRGPLSLFLGQGMYHVEHDALGDFDLFLVPVGREQDGFRYEAVFNRMLEA